MIADPSGSYRTTRPPSQADTRNWLIRLWAFVDFWSALDGPDLLADETREDIASRIKRLEPKSHELMIKALERQYDETHKDLESQRSRATALLAGTGIITGVIAFAVPVSGALRPLITFDTIPHGTAAAILGLSLAVILYSATAATWLGVRAVDVIRWTQVLIHPVDNAKPADYGRDYMYSLYLAWWENKERLRNPAGYLRQAYRYYRILVVTLALLVGVAIIDSLVILPNFKVSAQPRAITVQPSQRGASPATTPRAASSPRTP